MKEQLHFATQYLATAGKSFLEHRADDSHTNIGFNSQNGSFETWELDHTGIKLLLDVPNFTLRWSAIDAPELALNDTTHAQVVDWLALSSKKVGLDKPYEFNLHYELPFSWNGDFLLELKSAEDLKVLIHLRILANLALETFLESEKLTSDIRVWPHHFDTGAFVILEDGSGKSIGLGMAIPDSLVNDHYFYISGYKGHQGLDTSHFKDLANGEWKNEGFKGAVLPATNMDETTVVHFFKEAYRYYTNN